MLSAKYTKQKRMQEWKDKVVNQAFKVAGCNPSIKAEEYLSKYNTAFVYVFESGAGFGGAKKGQRASIHVMLTRYLIGKVSTSLSGTNCIVASDGALVCGNGSLSNLSRVWDMPWSH